MSDALASGLAADANDPPELTTIDGALDAVFDAPEVSDPSSPSEPDAQPVAATQQPQVATTPDGGSKGEPPKERWDQILDNARKKAREDTLAEHREHLEVVHALKTDYAGTLAKLLEEGAADTRFSDVLTAKAAALLAARGNQAKANAEPEPDLQTSDGALVYSADQLRKWHQWNQTATTAKLTEQFKPLQELQQQFEQVKQTQADQRVALSIAEERGSMWKSAPLFAEHKDAILSRQAELYAEAEAAFQRGEGRFDPVNTPWMAMQQAYNEVITTQALPKLQSQQTDNLVAVAARKRAGSSSDPAATAPAQPRTPRTVDEALDQVYGRT